MTFDEVELNYILEAVRYFQEKGIPNLPPTDRAVYIAEVDAILEKVVVALDGPDYSDEA
jgi:hypothetical protein